MDVLSAMHRSHSYAPTCKSRNFEADFASKSKSRNVLQSEMNETILLREQYNRLLESHHRLLRVNQNLEDKLLKVVTTCEEQKTSLKAEVAELSEKLAVSQSRVVHLEEENTKYRRDCLLAVQLLQCNPTNFADCDFNRLPSYVRNKLEPPMSRKNNTFSDSHSCDEDDSHSSSYNQSEDIEIYPFPFPPTALMVPKRKKETRSYAPSPGAQNPSYRISAERVAEIIDKDINSLDFRSLDYDMRSRQPVLQKDSSANGRILHV